MDLFATAPDGSDCDGASLTFPDPLLPVFTDQYIASFPVGPDHLYWDPGLSLPEWCAVEFGADLGTGCYEPLPVVDPLFISPHFPQYDAFLPSSTVPSGEAAAPPTASTTPPERGRVVRSIAPKQPSSPRHRFTLWDRLPVEVRYSIWKLAVTPRRITVTPIPTTLASLVPTGFRDGTRLTWHASPTPSVLLASREANHAARRLYSRRLFPCPMVPAHCGGGGLEPVAIPINPEQDAIEFSAGQLLDPRGLPTEPPPDPDGTSLQRLLLPLVGLTVYDKPLPGIGWAGWADSLRHISFSAALIGHAANEDLARRRGSDTQEIWSCLIQYMEASPAFQTCTIAIGVPEGNERCDDDSDNDSESGAGGGGASRFLARTKNQCDNIRAIRIARRPGGAGPDDAFPCTCHQQQHQQPARRGNTRKRPKPPKLKKKHWQRASPPKAMKLSGDASCLLLDDPRLRMECPIHVAPEYDNDEDRADGKAKDDAGAGGAAAAPACPSHPRPLLRYRHHLAIFELLDGEQRDLFCRGGNESGRTRARRWLHSRMSRHFCTADCHRPRQATFYSACRLPTPASLSAAPAAEGGDAAVLASQADRDLVVAGSESSAGPRDVVFGDSFEGDMFLLLHRWIMCYRQIGVRRLKVGVHGVCLEGYGW